MGPRACRRVAMDPKWHPLALMVLGAGLVTLTYVTSASYPPLAVTLGMTLGGLTLASGITLAFFQTFRREYPRR